MNQIMDDVSEILYDEATIERKVAQMGNQIALDYAAKELVMVVILKGAVVYAADLMRHIPIKITLDFMAISSYGHGSETSGIVRILKDLDQPVENKHVLIIEDIVDTGLTLDYLSKNILSKNPASLRTCVLLDKPEKRKIDLTPDYLGFTTPDKFVVGYGLDYGEKYRNLPFIGALKSKIDSGNG